MSNGPFDDLLPSPDELLLMDEDLSRISQLAARGEAAAIMAGPIAAWWGFTLALASLGFILRFYGLLPATLPISPIQFILGYGGTLGFLLFRGKRIKFNVWQSQAVLTIWIFAGASIFLFNLGCALIHEHNMMLINAVLCLIFAMTMGVMGAANRRRWMLIPAIGWMTVGFAMFFLDDVVIRQTTLGLSSAAFMMVPGLIMMVSGKVA